MAGTDNNQKRVSMADVAALAGVSPATVSRVINRYDGVSDEISALVNGAISNLGYRPPQRHRVDVAAFTMALLVLDDHYLQHVDVFNFLLNGVSVALNRSNASLLLIKSSDPSVIAARLNEYTVHGLILAGTRLDPRIRKVIDHLPRVWLSSYHDESGDHVLAGNEQIGQAAARYLIEQRGHARLGYLVSGNSYPAFRIRQRAFQHYGESKKADVAAIHAQLPNSPQDATGHLGFLEREAEALVDGLLATDPMPTGLFVPYDLLTALVYRHLQKRGSRIGLDLEIVSCNNQPTCLAGLTPRPATIDICAETIGTHAVEQLLWRIKYPEMQKNVQVLVEPVLVPGETLRKPWEFSS